MSKNRIEDPARSIAENLLMSTGVGAIPSIVSLYSTGSFMNGARCKIRINNQLVAFAFQVAWTVQTSQDEINVIDEYLPTELAPKRMRCTGTLGCFRIPGLGASSLGFQPNILSFLFHKYVSIEVTDKKSGNVLFYASHAVITERSESISAQGTATMQLQFQAIGFQDELKPGLPT